MQPCCVPGRQNDVFNVSAIQTLSSSGGNAPLRASKQRKDTASENKHKFLGRFCGETKRKHRKGRRGGVSLGPYGSMTAPIEPIGPRPSKPSLGGTSAGVARTAPGRRRCPRHLRHVPSPSPTTITHGRHRVTPSAPETYWKLPGGCAMGGTRIGQFSPLLLAASPPRVGFVFVACRLLRLFSASSADDHRVAGSIPRQEWLPF